jgi:predicted nuclease of restriction endonuclease-like (RecB) superfamily
MNFLDTNLYERQGKAVSNFTLTLPLPDSDLAQEITKDPYNFDFLTLTTEYKEKELKDALMGNIQKFLLELGKGFAFVSREYRLEVGNTEQFIDMLFYNIRLHCYIVVEVKIRDFDPRDMGQIGTYVSAVNGILKSDADAPTIGILICKSKDNILAKYAVDSTSEPVGISEYQLTALLEKNFKGTLPAIEDIEKCLE